LKVIPVIEAYLNNRLSDDRKVGCFHPSAISMCPRKLYESYLVTSTVAPEGNPNLSRIFDNGKHVHLRIQKYLKDSGILIEDEVEFYNEDFEICGSADGIIELDGSLGVVEIKSINTDGFLKLIKPKPEHIEQLNIYMYCLRRTWLDNPDPDSKDLTWGSILYECKNTQKMKEYTVEIDYRLLSKLFKKVALVREYLKEGKVPSKVSHRDCKWCEIKDCE
jgi:CRISPR/Cas system-associated exonuclease Cas4 (RecB family)